MLHRPQGDMTRGGIVERFADARKFMRAFRGQFQREFFDCGSVDVAHEFTSAFSALVINFVIRSATLSAMSSSAICSTTRSAMST